MKITLKVLVQLSFFLFANIINAQKKEKLPAKIEIQKAIIVKDTLKTLAIVDSVAVDTVSNWKMYKETARASYYAEKFNGRRTASGKKFDMTQLTAAHKKLPFGTMLKITNIANQKSVIIEITDRGPFVKTREIDLSKRAFMDIADNKRGGLMTVKIEIMKDLKITLKD